MDTIFATTLTGHKVVMALLLTLGAGMSTVIGATLAFFTKRTNTKLLSAALGLSGGVMVYVSFMELMPQAFDELSGIYAETEARIWTLVSFFGGIGLIALIDSMIPEDENPHELQLVENIEKEERVHGNTGRLKRTGMMLALTIGVHNFPEGMATFVSALEAFDVALPIVVAIAIHNIPEGIAVSVPLYHATGNRRKSFWMAAFSGLAEPLGALFGALFLLPFWTPVVSAVLLAAVAGIMVYISFDELLPSAEEYGHHHYAIGGVVVGMAIMGCSLLFM